MPPGIRKNTYPAEDPIDSLSVTPSVIAERAVNGRAGRSCLARGVLYALEPAKGELLWRDASAFTRGLTRRVPADTITPELELVLCRISAPFPQSF